MSFNFVRFGIVIGVIIVSTIIFKGIKILISKSRAYDKRQIVTATNKLNASKKIKKKIELPDDDVKYYNALKTNKSKRSIRYWKDLLMDRRHPDETLLINMEMTNGFHRTFIVRNINNQFTYKKRVYIIDNDLKYYNMDSKLWQLDYHENLTIPVKRSIPVEQIRKSIKAANLIPSQSTNPALIEKFIQSKILESLMKGGQFMESLKKFSFYLIIIMTIAVIHFLLFVYGSGMLSNFKIPGF